MSLVGGGVETLGELGLGEDTASTETVVVLGGGGDPDVTFLSPGGTPGVLNDEVIGSVTDGSDGVVKSDTASSGDDTLGVELEGVLVSFDDDSNWLLVNGGEEVLDVLGGDESSTSDSGLGGLGGIVGTLGVLTDVGVVSFGFESVGSDVGHSEVGPSSVATVAGLVTIDDLLFREGGQGVTVDLVETFRGGNGSESPA